MKRTSFIWSLTGVAAILGFMLTVQLSTHVTQAKAATGGQSELDLMSQITAQEDQNKLSDEQIAQAREQLQKFQSAGPTESQQASVLKQDAKQIQQAAGLTSVTGPGLLITVGDGGGVNDTSIPYIVNALISDGANAIAIGGSDGLQPQRLTTISTIREVSAGDINQQLQVNQQPLLPPYQIYAEGNVSDMLAVLNVEQIGPTLKGWKITYSVQTEKAVTIPGYDGQMPGQFAKEVPAQ